MKTDMEGTQTLLGPDTRRGWPQVGQARWPSRPLPWYPTLQGDPLYPGNTLKGTYNSGYRDLRTSLPSPKLRLFCWVASSISVKPTMTGPYNQACKALDLGLLAIFLFNMTH